MSSVQNKPRPLVDGVTIAFAPTVEVMLIVNLMPLLLLSGVLATLNKEKVKIAGGPTRLAPSAVIGRIDKGLRLFFTEALKFWLAKPIENLTGFGSDSTSQHWPKKEDSGMEDPVNIYYNYNLKPSTSPKNPTGVAFASAPTPVEAII